MPYSAPTPPDGFEPWEEETARAVVRSFLVARGGCVDEEIQQDLVQECLLQWWLRRGRYDTTRGANRRTFMNRVCENRLRDLWREQRAARRRGLQADMSLEREGDSEPSLQDSIADPAAADPQHEADLSALRDRLLNVRHRLTARQRALVDALLQGFEIGEASAQMGVPRSSLYDELRRLRTPFRDAGLEEFLR